MSSGKITRTHDGEWKLAWENTATSKYIGQGYQDTLFDISSYDWGRLEFAYVSNANQRQLIEFPLYQPIGGVRMQTVGGQYLTANNTNTKQIYSRRMTTVTQEGTFMGTQIWFGNGMHRVVNATNVAATASSGDCVPLHLWVK